MSNVLAVGLSKGKYYENTNLYFENKHAYQPLSSASRGCPRKRPSTVLCNSNRDIFCVKNEVRRQICLMCCSLYYTSWYVVCVLLLTNCSAECRYYTVIT